jgi:hypothetical protein
MKFNRTLKPEFINSLNELYKDKNSWWRTIVDDKDVFILIRNNQIRAQVSGGLLLEISQNAQKKLMCRMSDLFLTLHSGTVRYVTIDETTTAPTERIEGLRGLVKHYDKVKARIKNFTGREKQVVQYLANNTTQVVDFEIGFEGKLKEGAVKKSVPRIDMAAITNGGTLVFFEVKLFENSEIRAKETETPKVAGQLLKYEKLLAQYGRDIIAGYKEQLRVYSQLEGKFFKSRVSNFSEIDLYPQARLIITGFDGPQRDIMLPVVRKGIVKGYTWQNEKNDFIATGNHQSLTKSRRLFLGLK